jgi:glycosyltransferase involved in cell wall biosynthesis
MEIKKTNNDNNKITINKQKTEKNKDKYITNSIIKMIIIISTIHFSVKEININNNKISVIIPTYNRAYIITKSIYSVLNQTYKNLELLIIDDNSKDNTKQIIEKINDHRIKYIKLKKNMGSNYARNLGIKKARGTYITFQDSDDIYLKDKLEKQLKNLIDNKSDLDFCKVRIHKRLIHITPNYKRERNILKNGLFDELSYGNCVSTQAILVKTNIIRQYMFDNELPRFQDYDLLLRMLSKIKVSYTRHILVDLYTRKDSISYSRTKLEKAKKILSKKNYDFNSNQKKNFINWVKNAS